MSRIDVFKDPLISLPDLAEQLPVPPSSTTLRRWYTKGVNGARLATVLIGRSRFTTKVAFAEFVSAQSGVCESPAACE